MPARLCSSHVDDCLYSALGLGLREFDPRTNVLVDSGNVETVLADIVKLTGQSMKQLEARGRRFAARGAVLDRRRKAMTIGHVEVSTPPLSDDISSCHDIDQIYQITHTEPTELAGNTWQKNSCHIDSIIVAGLLTSAWRRSKDAIHHREWESLSRPAKAFRTLMLADWSRASERQKDDLRNHMWRCLEQFDSSNFAFHEMAPIGSMAMECFKGVPHMTYTFVNAWKCCDNVLRTDTGSRIQERSAFGMIGTAHNIEDKIQHSLESWSEIQKPCQNAGCSGTARIGKVVCHRLPDTLTVYGDGWKPRVINNANTTKISLRYRVPSGDVREASYKLGGVFLRRGLHFFVRWNRLGRIWEYDDQVARTMRDRGTSGILSRLKENDVVVWLFYEKYRDEILLQHVADEGRAS